MRAIPEGFGVYKKTPIFDENTIPAGLLNAHQTKSGTWGRIVVLKGELLYRILEPIESRYLLDPNQQGVVEPEILHDVTPQGAVQFYVEFLREDTPRS